METIRPTTLYLLCGKIAAGKSTLARKLAERPKTMLVAQANVAHELHLLDLPDDICKQRLERRNVDANHPYQIDVKTYDLFTSYFAPPEPDEGFNIVRHTI